MRTTVAEGGGNLVYLTAVGHPLDEILARKPPLASDAHGGDVALAGQVVDRPGGHPEGLCRAVEVEDFPALTLLSASSLRVTWNQGTTTMRQKMGHELAHIA